MNPPSAIRIPQFTTVAAGAITGVPVREFRFLPFGRVDIIDAIAGSSFTFTAAKADELMAAFRRRGTELQIDYDHQGVGFNQRADGRVPAAGWIGGFEARRDGLYATDVRWTAAAAQLLAAGEYRYFSPVIYWDSPDYAHVTGIGPVALTNYPAMANTPKLVAGGRSTDCATQCAARELGVVISPTVAAGTVPARLAAAQQGSDAMDSIAQIVGLPAGSSLDQILAAITAENLPAVAQALGLDATAGRPEVEQMLTELARRSSGDTGGGGGGGGGNNTGPNGGTAKAAMTAAGRAAAVATIAAGLGLSGVADEAALIAAVKPRLAQSAGVDHATVAGMLQEIQTLKARLDDQEFDVLCASGKGQGKIAPALRETYRSIFRSNRQTFDELLEKMPVLADERSVFAGDKGAVQTVTGGGNAITDATTADDWDKHAEFKAEFPTKEVFAHYLSARRDGRVRIKGE